MPSRRLAISACSIVSLLGLAGVAAAQGQGPDGSLQFNVGVRFVAALVINLVLGGALVALGPRYARERVGELRDDPAGAFGWGLFAGIAVPIALVLLAITIIGLVVTIPGLIALFFVGLVGEAVTVVWIGSLVTGSRTEPAIGGKAAAIGALVLAVPMAIPILGDLVVSIAGFFGLGVVARHLYASWKDDGSRRGRAAGTY